MGKLVFFDIGHPLLLDFDLCAPTLLIFLTLVNHCCWTLARLCAPNHSTRLVFFILVIHYWWTLVCALPRVLSFSHWSANLKKTRHCQSLLVDFGLCAPTRVVFLILVSRCLWTLACALPLVLSFFDAGQSLLLDFDLFASTRLVFF